MLPLGGLDIRGPRLILYAAAALSLVAALIHLWVMPEHFEEWWGYGTFFLVSALAQGLYVPLLLRSPNRTVVLLGIAGNLAIVLLYLLTRTVGIPLFGPEAGEVERRCLERRRSPRLGVDCDSGVSERGVTVEESGERDYQSAQDHVREGRRLAREAFRALKEGEPGAEEDVRSTIEKAISELEQALKSL